MLSFCAMHIIGKKIYAERQYDVLGYTCLEGENYGDGTWTVVLEGMSPWEDNYAWARGENTY